VSEKVKVELLVITKALLLGVMLISWELVRANSPDITEVKDAAPSAVVFYALLKDKI